MGIDSNCVAPVEKPFNDPDYIFELKHDGFRAIACVQNHECKLVSRNLNHLRFGALAATLGKLPVHDAILDGEIDADELAKAIQENPKITYRPLKELVGQSSTNQIPKMAYERGWVKEDDTWIRREDTGAKACS